MYDLERLKAALASGSMVGEKILVISDHGMISGVVSNRSRISGPRYNGPELGYDELILEDATISHPDLGIPDVTLNFVPLHISSISSACLRNDFVTEDYAAVAHYVTR